MHLFAGRVSHTTLLKLLLVSAFLLVPALSRIQAQTTDVHLSVISLNPAKLRIEVAGNTGTSWSFRNTYTRIVGLAERVDNFRGSDDRGRDVSLRKLAPGEFRSTEGVAKVSYEMILTPPSNLGDMSHVSWLTEEHGFFMLGDLLPQSGSDFPVVINLTLDLPLDWVSAASLDPINKGRYMVTGPEQAVFLVGRSLREKKTRIGATEIRVVTGNGWAFKDSDVIKIVGKLIKENSTITRHPLSGKVALLLVPFRAAVGSDRWSAETRGRNVVLLMGREAPRDALLARLRVVLAHELFHLWVPNSLALDGDYDWFFEGFTLYQAMLTALQLRYISFNDYLDTLARVYDSYRSSPERDKLSLIEASERRWTTSSLVYDKGMLVAFIYDLMLRQSRGNRATVSDVYPDIFGTGLPKRRDANELILSILSRRNGMEQFVRDYVQGTGRVDLVEVLRPFGLIVETTGSITELKVKRNLDADQSKLLKSLGYRR